LQSTERIKQNRPTDEKGLDIEPGLSFSNCELRVLF